jgi:hypothetical protein
MIMEMGFVGSRMIEVQDDATECFGEIIAYHPVTLLDFLGIKVVCLSKMSFGA